MYSKDHIMIEKDDGDSKELLLGGHMKGRNKHFKQWLEERSENADVGIETHLCILLPSTAMMSEWSTFGKAVLPKLQRKLLDTSHFSGFLLNNTTFQEFVKLSMGGESERISLNQLPAG
jgi:hypothetical protein